MPFVKIKRLFRIMPWLLALGLASVFVAFLHYEWAQQESLWREGLGLGVEMQTLQVESNRWHITLQAVQAAELISKSPQIRAAIRAGYAAHLQDASGTGEAVTAARAELARQLAPYWEDLQALNARYLEVHLPPEATVFLRMHRPERFGDRVDNLRPLVMEVLTSGEIHSGMEVSRHGAGYRGVVPVFADDASTSSPIAAIEVGLGLLSMRPHPTGSGRAVLLAPGLFENVLWDKARGELTLPRHHVQGQWLLESFSDPMVEQWFIAGLLPDPALTGSYRIIQWKGRDYLVKNIAIKDFHGEKNQQTPPVASVISWRDITEEQVIRAETRRDTLVKWLVALLLVEAVMLVLWHMMRRYVRSLMDEHRIVLEQERDQSEMARQRLALALASSESGFWELDIISGQSVFSPEWRAMCGVPPDHPLLPDSEEWTSRIHPNDKSSCLGDLLRHVKGETPMYENEHRVRTFDGSYKWVYTRGKVVEWLKDGRSARVLGVYTDISGRKNNELIILRQQAGLRVLNEIASLPAVEYDEQLRRSLTLGANHLGMQYGIISRIQDDNYTVKVQVSPNGKFHDGQKFQLQQTPCALTLSDGDVVAIPHLADSSLARHPAHTELQLRSYIGVPLWVEGDVYGTVSFSSPNPRAFDAQDKDFMRLLASWMGSVIAHWLQEARQRELYQRLTKLSERLPGFLYQFQLWPDGTSLFPYASTGIRNVYGIEPSQLTVSAKAIFDVIHPADVERVGASVMESAANLTTWRVSYRVNHPERGMIWVQGDAQPERLEDGSVLWHGFISDVTAAKDAEQHLQEINALRQAIFDAASVAIISVDKTGVIKTFNPGAEKILGYSARELVGHNGLSLFHLPEEMARHARELSLELGYEVTADFEAFVAKARRGHTDENEWTYVHRDGTHVPVLLAVTCLRDAQGEINGFVGIARDISELKRMDRLKSEFISTVSHELRTPLTAISGSLGLIASGATGELPPNVFKMVSIAHKNSLRLNHLVNDLLDMEKLVAGKMDFDMRSHALLPIVQQALEENAAYANQYQVSYQLLGKDVDVQVLVDAARLSQVLANFLSNAAKFSPTNSEIAITVSLHRKLARVAVSDNGSGIPEEFRGRIFQKFSQADSSDRRQKGGTGLGLAICKELIERMGGTIGFESVEGVGSTFYFDLPCVSNSTVDLMRRIDRAVQGKNILVVEDHQDVAELLATILRNANYQVDVAHTGATAKLYLAQRDYDLVTLDLLLPDMNGLQVLHHIRQHERTAHVPVVVVSASIDEGRLAVSQDIGLGGVDWLEKPLSESRLLHLVEEAVINHPQASVRILHVEDDVDVQQLIALSADQHAQFDAAATLAEAREKINQYRYQLIILDLGLPDGNGWELVPELRRIQPQAKVIVLSSDELTDDQKAQIEMSFIKCHQSNSELVHMIEKLLYPLH